MRKIYMLFLAVAHFFGIGMEKCYLCGKNYPRERMTHLFLRGYSVCMNCHNRMMHLYFQDTTRKEKRNDERQD